MTTLKRLRSRPKGKASARWLVAAGLLGLGLLPCPGCGARMIMHVWPAALAVTLSSLRSRSPSACAASRDDQPDGSTDDCGPGSTGEIVDDRPA